MASSCSAFTVATFCKIVTVYMLFMRAHCHRHKCVNSHVIMSLIDIYQFVGHGSVIRVLPSSDVCFTAWLSVHMLLCYYLWLQAHLNEMDECNLQEQ